MARLLLFPYSSYIATQFKLLAGDCVLTNCWRNARTKREVINHTAIGKTIANYSWKCNLLVCCFDFTTYLCLWRIWVQSFIAYRLPFLLRHFLLDWRRLAQKNPTAGKTQRPRKDILWKKQKRSAGQGRSSKIYNRCYRSWLFIIDNHSLCPKNSVQLTKKFVSDFLWE